MTVAEFVDWLQTQDQEATVLCIVHDRSGSYYKQGGTATNTEFTPELSEYTDLRGNQFVKPGDFWFGKRYLLIGESD